MRILVAALVLAGCGDDGGLAELPDAPVFPDAAEAPDAAPTCAPITGGGTVHSSSVTAAETWTAADSPHVLPFDMSITATLTIEPCAVVRIGGGRIISVRAGGAIETHGLPGQPVRIERADPATAWVNIRTLNGGTLAFTQTVISGGGDPLNSPIVLAAAIDVAGTTPLTAPILHADGLVVEGSESQGILLHDGGGFSATSTNVRITGSAGAPIHTFARHAGTIPPGDYTGNAVDEIVLRATGGPEAIVESMTLHARGVPYHVGIQPNSTLDVAAAAGVPVLTIEPGVTLRFEPSATLRIDPATGALPARGALVAIGTPAAPIVFTSAAGTPAAGDWFGIRFGNIPNAATKLQHARVEFAGRASISGSESCLPVGQVGQNDAAIRILGAEPVPVFITDTTIHASARHGIDRGFRSNTKPDFLATNTFTEVAGCKQTHPRDVSGVCPAVVPCP
ncbi:MAG: hypothetical protein ABI867_45250 [Kofleriaceae bacterium]